MTAAPVVPVVNDFKAFLTKSNALALAIGVIIGASLDSVVTTLVNAVIMPPIGWPAERRRLRVDQDRCSARTRRPVRRSRSAGACCINSLIVFVIVMLVVYVISRLFIKEAPPPGPSAEEILLTEIRDELRRRPS